jgi:hypothetical protein
MEDTADKTWLQAVKAVTCKTMTDKEAHDWLWSCSCFPFGTPEQTLDGIKDYWQRSNGDLEVAIDLSHQDLLKATEKE